MNAGDSEQIAERFQCAAMIAQGNHLVEAALDAATAGDMQPFAELLTVLADPFTERAGLERFAQPDSPWAPAHRTFCGT